MLGIGLLCPVDSSSSSRLDDKSGLLLCTPELLTASQSQLLQASRMAISQTG
jgi:hypothetical protein